MRARPSVRAGVDLANLTPLGQIRAGRRARRLTQLLVGLGCYGVSMAMRVRSTLGLAPGTSSTPASPPAFP